MSRTRFFNMDADQPPLTRKRTTKKTSTSTITKPNTSTGQVNLFQLNPAIISTDGEEFNQPPNPINTQAGNPLLQQQPPQDPWAQLNLFQQNISNMLEDKFREQDAKRKLDQNKTTKRSKVDITFKYKTNELQYKFLEDINDYVDEAKDLAASGSKKRLASCLDDISSTVSKRQKIIRLADKSPAGWDTVKEYVQDELASDSDDDKKMRQAENRAITKKKQQTKVQKPRTTSFQPNLFGQRFQSQPSFVQPAFVQPHQSPLINPQPQRFVIPQQATLTRFPMQHHPANTCFHCGLPGHWKHSCPNKGKGG
ncbi:uncharacterized protein [Clytia hemisphaerica]|uniref:uncharacterized protein n=1 Tax=Clytia hemisphaerica TaxID=252671 RepID=UPI0034D7816D